MTQDQEQFSTGDTIITGNDAKTHEGIIPAGTKAFVCWCGNKASEIGFIRIFCGFKNKNVPPRPSGSMAPAPARGWLAGRSSHLGGCLAQGQSVARRWSSAQEHGGPEVEPRHGGGSPLAGGGGLGYAPVAARPDKVLAARRG